MQCSGTIGFGSSSCVDPYCIICWPHCFMVSAAVSFALAVFIGASSVVKLYGFDGCSICDFGRERYCDFE